MARDQHLLAFYSIQGISRYRMTQAFDDQGKTYLRGGSISERNVPGSHS